MRISTVDTFNAKHNAIDAVEQSDDIHNVIDVIWNVYYDEFCEVV